MDLISSGQPATGYWQPWVKTLGLDESNLVKLNIAFFLPLLLFEGQSGQPYDR